MRPDYHQAIIDTIRFYGWKKIIYLYDSHDGKCTLYSCLQFNDQQCRDAAERKVRSCAPFAVEQVAHIHMYRSFDDIVMII